MLRVECFGVSDVGLVRSDNEDAFLVREDLGFVALADGMGGAAAGELASKYFVDAAEEVFSCASDGSPDITRRLHETFELANKKILHHTSVTPAHSGMGCTAEILAFYDDVFAVAHVGDSRTYQFRDLSLRLLTRDQSFVQRLLDTGQISAEEALTHPMRHVILSAVGQEQGMDVEMINGAILPGDIFLLCSDGLTDMAPDTLISEILSSSSDLETKAAELIGAAKYAGGLDNVTVVLCAFTAK